MRMRLPRNVSNCDFQHIKLYAKDIHCLPYNLRVPYLIAQFNN